ncbi:tyrosine-type recombinase/integrase [Pseudopedobacter beijingensis]|uniref:Tyrosine recombinase XerC n=1 Tax=Pseudopedobacter beijingensis TaxID=1207056 RepID=A0ABW4IFM5_9SPHI
MFLERFFNYISFEKRYSQHTISSYRLDISQFQAYLSISNIDLLSVNHHDIRGWILSLSDDGIENRSVNRKISTLKTFYKFLVREGMLEINPTQKISTPKIAKELPVFIEVDKMDFLLDNEFFDAGFEGERDRLVLEFLFGTGVRLIELINIDNKNIDLVEGKVKVLGKRNKERIVPLSKTLVQLIEKYQNLKLSSFEGNISTSLIVTNKGTKVYPKFIYRIVRKYLSFVTTRKKRSPHVLRHTFATALLNAGADINAIKDLLGHANLAATQIYTHNSIERIKSIYKQAHPKA